MLEGRSTLQVNAAEVAQRSCGPPDSNTPVPTSRLIPTASEPERLVGAGPEQPAECESSWCREHSLCRRYVHLAQNRTDPPAETSNVDETPADRRNRVNTSMDGSDCACRRRRRFLGPNVWACELAACFGIPDPAGGRRTRSCRERRSGRSVDSRPGTRRRQGLSEGQELSRAGDNGVSASARAVTGLWADVPAGC